MKKVVRKYSVYNAMEKALRKDDFEFPGVLATFLMDIFLDGDGFITLNEAQGRSFCGKNRGDFSAWRDRLVEHQWISYDHQQALESKTIGKCLPGKRLNRYLNKEKLQNETLVTTRMLDKKMAKVDVLQDLVKVLIEKIDPPYTEEKEDAYLADSEAFYDAIEMKILESGSRRNSRKKPEHPDYTKALKN